MPFGRVVLALTAVALLTMPITQHIWTWDHFLRGGQDFETCASMTLVCLCLILVLARCCKQSVDALFAVLCRLQFIRKGFAPGANWQTFTFDLRQTEGATSTALDRGSSPLRI